MRIMSRVISMQVKLGWSDGEMSEIQDRIASALEE